MPLVDRLAALSGLAGSIVTIVGFYLADPWRTGLNPDPTDPSSLIAEALVANRQPTRIAAQLTLLGGFLMLWFVSYLYSQLREAEGSSDWSSTLVLGGGSILVTLIIIDSGFQWAASEIINYGSDTQVARVIHLWGWNSASLLVPGFAGMLFGSAVAGFRHGAVQRWFAWFSDVMFVIIILIAVVLGTPGLGAGVGLLWTAIASLNLGFARRAHSKTTSGG